MSIVGFPAAISRLHSPSPARPRHWGVGRVVGWGAVVALLAAAIALLEPTILLAAVGGTIATVTVLAQPLLAVAMLLFAVPFGTLPRPEGEVSEVSLSVAEPLVALLALAWLLRGVRRHRITLRGGALMAGLAGLGILMAFSMTYATGASAAAKETLKWLELLILVAVVWDAAPDRAATGWLLAALFVAGAAEAAWGAVQFATGSGPQGFEVAGALRAFGHFEQPNPFGGYLSTILPVAVAVALVPGRGPLRWVAAGSAAVLGVGIFLSQSRGAWLGLGVAGLVGMLTWSRKTRLLLLPTTGLGILGVALALSGFVPSAILDRLGQTVEYFGVFDVRTVELTTDNWAVVERMAHWQAAWYMFLDHPWLGVGVGNYAEAYPNYYLDNWIEPLGHAHNYYLNTLAELGVLGFGLLLLALALLFRGLVGALRASQASASHDRRFWRALVAGILGSFVVFCVHNLFDNLLVHSVNVQMGFLLGLALSAADRLRVGAEGGKHHAG